MQQVIAVSLCATHAFSKQVRPAIRLLKGLGVEGDAHHGVTVKHRSRVRQDPTQPNLRQVHLIHEELHDELRASGFAIGPGTMGASHEEEFHATGHRGEPLRHPRVQQAGASRHPPP
ncbi:hypothetical protein ACLXAZ_32965, partial [Escherichia coli]